MKRIFFICFFLIAILVRQSFGQCSINYNWSGFVGDTCYIHPGDTVKITLQCTCYDPFDGSCTNCTAHSLASGNGVISISPSTYGIIDTGLFTVGFGCSGSGFSCSNSYAYTFHALYWPTSVFEITPQNDLMLFPSVTSGLIAINKNIRCKNIYIANHIGNIVFLSSTLISEINLSDLAKGIYFYIIEDEKEKVYRGKIIKE